MPTTTSAAILYDVYTDRDVNTKQKTRDAEEYCPIARSKSKCVHSDMQSEVGHAARPITFWRHTTTAPMQLEEQIWDQAVTA